MAKSKMEEIPQNAEVSKKLPCEKPLLKQLEIMEEYTKVHKETLNLPKEIREIRCLNVLYPTLFREIQEEDKFIGRIDFLP
ncbi:MAG TPA: pyruvate formate-lyase, partial [Clostridium sp.]